MKKTTFILSFVIISVMTSFAQSYSVPTWTADGGLAQNDIKWKDTYLTSATTSGATVNLNYSATARPSNFYYVHPTVIEVQSDATISLHLVAYSLGASSTSVVRQDLRYTCAYIYADFNGDKTFEKAYTRIGDQPPTHNVRGNMEVMDITQSITVPTVTTETLGRVRVKYNNAWAGGTTADNAVKEGIVYDFDIKIKPVAVGIEKVGEDLIKIISGSKKLSISAPEKSACAVYTVSGTLITNTILSNDYKELELPQGIYVIKITNQYGSFSKKAIVKN